METTCLPIIDSAVNYWFSMRQRFVRVEKWDGGGAVGVLKDMARRLRGSGVRYEFICAVGAVLVLPIRCAAVGEELFEGAEWLDRQQ